MIKIYSENSDFRLFAQQTTMPHPIRLIKIAFFKNDKKQLNSHNRTR